MDKLKLVFFLFCSMVAYYVYFFLTMKLITDIRWFMKAQINPIRFMKHFISNYLPFYLSILVLMVHFDIPKRFEWKKLFSWKIWVFPFLGFILFGVSQWQFNPVLNYQTRLFGFTFKWQWAAMVQWSVLFIVQLFLYQKNGMDKVLAFVTSFYGVFLAGILYEIPWYHRTAKWSYLSLPKNLFVASMFPTLLYAAKWRFSRLLILGLVPLLISFPFFFKLPPGSYWLPRLSTFPLFIMIPLSLKKKESKEFGRSN